MTSAEDKSSIGDRELYGELTRLNNELVNMQRETFKMSAALESQKQELLRTNAILEDANRRLESLAMQDGLTGLSNHRAFQERLAAEVRRSVRYPQPLALVMLDVDYFKQYNDAYGHPEGDAVLKQVASLLQNGVRETDLACRYGGEEFALILTQTSLDDALLVAERLRAAIESACWEKRAVTISLGVCALSETITDPASLIACADQALYRSKKEGKNRVTSGGPAALSAMMVLRQQTRAHHQAVERRMTALLDAATRQEYVHLLQRLLGYYQPLEARLSALPDALPDGERRQKSDLLRCDLEYLGVSPEEIRCLPQCERLPDIQGITQALGCLYVLEGATLGGQIILRYLQEHLGVEAGRGGSFFASYGALVGPMWKAFGQFVNTGCPERAGQDVLVRAACETFDTLNGWLFDGEPDSRENDLR